MVAAKGDQLKIKRVFPGVGEYRAKIGAPRECFLVFKGKTKIGMIPHKIIAKYGKEFITDCCRITKMDKDNSTILVEM